MAASLKITISSAVNVVGLGIDFGFSIGTGTGTNTSRIAFGGLNTDEINSETSFCAINPDLSRSAGKISESIICSLCRCGISCHEGLFHSTPLCPGISIFCRSQSISNRARDIKKDRSLSFSRLSTTMIEYRTGWIQFLNRLARARGLLFTLAELLLEFTREVIFVRSSSRQFGRHGEMCDDVGIFGTLFLSLKNSNRFCSKTMIVENLSAPTLYFNRTKNPRASSSAQAR